MAYIDTALSNLNSRYQEIVDLIPDPYYYCDDYGNLKVNIPDYDGIGYADYIYIENTGKVFFVGNSRLDDGEDEYSIVKRLNSDGSLDTSFMNVKFTGGNIFVRGIGKQSTGKYVVVGSFNAVDGNSATRICRLNADGSFDSSFSTGSGFDNNVLGCHVLSDDSIICFGSFINYDETTSARLCKLNSDGTINTAFTSNINVVNFDSDVFAVEILSSGKMYVGGSFTNRIILLNADGSQDTSPDWGSGFNDRVASIKVQSDNKIMIGRCVLHEFYNDGQQYYCNKNNVVSFCWDHIDRSTKLATISQMIGQATKKQLTDEMAKCWLVCHNCHSLKGYENSDHLPIEVIERKRNELTLFDMDLL